MAVRVVLIDPDGRLQTLTEPAGGTFDAAGDFDRLLGTEGNFSVWPLLDPYGEWSFDSGDLADLLSDLDALEPKTTSEAERRGLARLRRLAERAMADPSLTLEFYDD